MSVVCEKLRNIFWFLAFLGCLCDAREPNNIKLPNIILLMSDDQGWGQVGYYNHPVLKTPNLDNMAEDGLRFDRFYAASPVCSPTRATILTGRSNDRTGVYAHGYPLRLQEKTIAGVLKRKGYITAHFGKWHLNGVRGPGVPILQNDPYGPGAFGFDYWLSSTNYFDLNPILSDMGSFREYKGDSSHIIISEAIRFIRNESSNDKPFFVVIWTGSPHSPFRAAEEDAAGFEHLDDRSKYHYAELVAFDRSVGVLRSELLKLKIADNTLLWFCSDNGGLPNVQPSSTGGLRGYKGSVYEGGLRVPSVVEWPGTITPGITDIPVSTLDIVPTLASILELSDSEFTKPLDGVSISPLLRGESFMRPKPVIIKYQNEGALISQKFKLLAKNIDEGLYHLYDLEVDPFERVDVSSKYLQEFTIAKDLFKTKIASIELSADVGDYSNGLVDYGQREREFWWNLESYHRFIEDWSDRPEYADQIRRHISTQNNDTEKN
jgi:arylsulfatase A-like enzyme